MEKRPRPDVERVREALRDRDETDEAEDAPPPEPPEDEGEETAGE